MSLNPATYNKTVGPGLTVLVMDTVRELVPPGGHTTLPAVVRSIAGKVGQPAVLRGRLYYNVHNRVKALKHAGLVETRKEYHNDGRMVAYSLIITLPSTCSE